jgi:hypothetical protein
MVGTMLAEIFMLRLESAARVLQEKLPSSGPQFVPFITSSVVKSKDVVSTAADGRPEKRTS